MSGPVEPADTDCQDELLERIESRQGRDANVGGLDVARVLPTKGRRTVGAWCFVDLIGPADAEQPDPLEVGPHPHIGLSTVTWLLEGEALHADSLGTEQVIRPGQLNLMTAGAGIAHAELAAQPPFRGVQMWLAQPEATRHGEARFEHFGDLPRFDVEGGHGDGTVFVGAHAGATSLAHTDTAIVGIDLALAGHPEAFELPLTQAFEHAVVPLDAPVKVGPEVIEPGWIGLVPAGVAALPLASRVDGRVLVLGGEPLGEPISMWWNFVARSRQEIEEAYLAWHDRTDRFGAVPSKLERIDAPRPPWMVS